MPFMFVMFNQSQSADKLNIVHKQTIWCYAKYTVCRCIWKDGSNIWQAFLDVCPHRLIPLSEGRLTDAKELQCAYHGWCFESSGKCTAIPQGGNANNPRTSATVYQCAVKQGKLSCFCSDSANHTSIMVLLVLTTYSKQLPAVC